MAKKQGDDLSAFLRERAAVVIEDDGPSGVLDMAEVLAWRRWFNNRQRTLRSSGGRPTNPDWNLKRQVPFSKDIWSQLEQRAKACSSEGRKIGPGQLAAFLIEDAVSHPSGSPVKAKLDEPTNDPRFDQWHQRGVFAGCVTE